MEAEAPNFIWQKLIDQFSLNSLFTFNAQIEIPPMEFMKIVDSKNKTFLWRGIPKIAHNSVCNRGLRRGGNKIQRLKHFCLVS